MKFLVMQFSPISRHILHHWNTETDMDSNTGIGSGRPMNRGSIYSRGKRFFCSKHRDKFVFVYLSLAKQSLDYCFLVAAENFARPQ
jgi:hypothetical protein